MSQGRAENTVKVLFFLPDLGTILKYFQEKTEVESKKKKKKTRQEKKKNNVMVE